MVVLSLVEALFVKNTHYILTPFYEQKDVYLLQNKDNIKKKFAPPPPPQCSDTWVFYIGCACRYYRHTRIPRTNARRP